MLSFLPITAAGPRRTFTGLPYSPQKGAPRKGTSFSTFSCIIALFVVLTRRTGEKNPVSGNLSGVPTWYMGSTLEVGSHGIRVPESSGIFSPFPEGMDFQEFEERLWETMNTILTLFGDVTPRKNLLWTRRHQRIPVPPRRPGWFWEEKD